ncbi:hypothetical protein [Streptomyces sp. VRA16 Mangrove soil]|uniref:DUF6881 domain-containing protein n=1 Tax=Streptomyces sp. VRA16 Mangrove soil TaxID=2817434 RepID=UPI001A9E206C|nr:hypothetical protein [Streptomyces sp. VRA16 Mangrove soil]MBO1336305.1 hypothetical protein [Streptomyces sp. VRA16 Mangrove soil]
MVWKELKKAAECGVFPLLRTLPLLDVLESPIESAVREVVDSLLTGAPIPEDALILLDDYRGATAGLSDVARPEYLQSEIALVAVQIGEARWMKRESPVHVHAYAETVWQVFDACLAKARGVSALTLSKTGLAEVERVRQEDDARAVAEGELDPTKLSDHLDLLRGGFTSARVRLAELVAECAWPIPVDGPCGRQCGWPTCAVDAGGCERHRRFQQTLAAELRRRQGAEPKTWYMQVWYSASRVPGTPREIVSEIGADGYERRKLAYYDDERVEWVDGEGGGIGRLALEEEMILSMREFRDRGGCSVEEITGEYFQACWDEALRNPSRSFLVE